MTMDKNLKKVEKREAAIYLDKFAWVGFSGIRQTDIIQAERYVTTKDNWEPTQKTFHEAKCSFKHTHFATTF